MASLDGSQSISTSEVGLLCLHPHGSSCLLQPLEGDLAIASLLLSAAIALFEVFGGACGSTSALQSLSYMGFFALAARCCCGNGHCLSVLHCHHKFLRSSLKKEKEGNITTI